MSRRHVFYHLSDSRNLGSLFSPQGSGGSCLTSWQLIQEGPELENLQVCAALTSILVPVWLPRDRFRGCWVAFLFWAFGITPTRPLTPMPSSQTTTALDRHGRRLQGSACHKSLVVARCPVPDIRTSSDQAAKVLRQHQGGWLPWVAFDFTNSTNTLISASNLYNHILLMTGQLCQIWRCLLNQRDALGLPQGGLEWAQMLVL